MATLYKRGKVYYLNWHDSTGQHRESLGSLSKHEAEIRRKDKELELLTGETHFAPSDAFGVLAVRYLDWHEGQFPDSHPRVRFILEKRLTDFHDTPLSEITLASIETWAARRAKATITRGEKVTKLKANTVTKELRTLKAVLRKGVEWGMLTTNPANPVKEKKSNDSAPMHWYTAADMKKLYKAEGELVELRRKFANPDAPVADYAPVWRLLANTGLRRAEAMHLRWEDVEADRLHVVSREGARTKSAEFRVVPLTPEARKALKQLRKGNDTPYVLPRMDKVSWSRAFAKTAERAGVGGSLHSLRHSFAANLVTLNQSLRVVQKLMGHASFVTTERYAHVAPSALEQAMVGLRL